MSNLNELSSSSSLRMKSKYIMRKLIDNFHSHETISWKKESMSKYRASFFERKVNRIESNRIENISCRIESNPNVLSVESNRIDLRFLKSRSNRIESNIALVESNRIRIENFPFFSVSDSHSHGNGNGKISGKKPFPQGTIVGSPRYVFILWCTSNPKESQQGLSFFRIFAKNLHEKDTNGDEKSNKVFQLLRMIAWWKWKCSEIISSFARLWYIGPIIFIIPNIVKQVCSTT
jgi:hypothetical protein